MFIENIVIGKPLVNPSVIFAVDEKDWLTTEKEKTLFTEERDLHKLLVQLGIVKSISEIRRNKPHFVVTLNELDFLEIKWGRRKLWILVGE